MLKVQENTHTKNRRLKFEAITNMDDGFSICHYKIKEPTNYFRDQTVFFERGVLYLDPKWLPSKLIIKSARLKMQFFFYHDFLSRTFTNHRTAGKEGGHFFNFSPPLPPAQTLQTLRHQPGNYCREITSAHRQQPDSNREPLVSERYDNLFQIIYQKNEFFQTVKNER